MQYHFSTESPVRWQDVDSFGVINNAVYFTLAEQTRFEYFDHLDLLRESNFPFVLGSTTCRFDAPGRLGMRLEIGTRVSRLGGKSFDMDFEFRNDGSLIASGTATLVWSDTDLRPMQIPDAARQRIADFEQIDPGPQADA